MKVASLKTFGFVFVLVLGPHVATAETIRDCDVCPELVEMPDGTLIGSYPVTRGQFRVFAQETGRVGKGCSLRVGSRRGWSETSDWTDPGYPQEDDHPVVCISWNDAVAYADWLTERTGHLYRLPTLEESARAAAGGATTEFWWGEDYGEICKFANTADASFRSGFPEDERNLHECDDGYVNTAPIGAFPANGWGVHDAVGNVWNWTNSCLRGDCSNAVFRGGGWDTPLRRYFHAEEYFGDRIILRNDVIGMRILRETE